MRGCVLAGLALLAPVAAFAAEPAWMRHATPDNAASVSVPCTRDELVSRDQDGAAGWACRKGDLIYALAQGSLAAATDPAQDEFDAMLAEARAEEGRSRVEVEPVKGRRSFVVSRPAGEPFGQVRMIEDKPRRPIMVIVMQDDAAPSVLEQSEPLAERVRRFTDSLELGGA